MRVTQNGDGSITILVQSTARERVKELFTTGLLRLVLGITLPQLLLGGVGALIFGARLDWEWLVLLQLPLFFLIATGALLGAAMGAGMPFAVRTLRHVVLSADSVRCVSRDGQTVDRTWDWIGPVRETSRGFVIPLRFSHGHGWLRVDGGSALREILTRHGKLGDGGPRGDRNAESAARKLLN